MLMKITLLFIGLLLAASAAAQQDHEPHPNGVIYGTAVTKLFVLPSGTKKTIVVQLEPAD
jgi:hypothetical protein